MNIKTHVLTITLLAIATLGSGIAVVYTQHNNRQLFIQLQQLQAERDKLEIEWEVLQLEQSTLVTDILIEKKARTRLKMSAPDPAQVLYITPP
ncbi:MAG: cell division protein FtsL [Candidatus Contendobacter odensis]|uniref:Cell division protein FtsL n=1 Tax=Candidatus Contendibacter odensensis TaxID=1400860 RepID=A0A2G6PFZ4_9GAMM|nr:MAG: cell division protein FtsL [Candidatus Contendobacter odensis]